MQRGEWKPAAYASRSLTETRYAQIEKEALGTTLVCECFSNYILGTSVSIEPDHKPLVPLLNTKHLDSLPPRVLRFRLCLARFAHVSVIMSQLPADKDRLEAYSKAQVDDPVCSQLIHFCHNGWPERHKVKENCYVIGQPEQTSPYVKAYFCMAHVLLYQRSCSTKPSARSIMATKG